mgnify:CR=1 FL=1
MDPTALCTAWLGNLEYWTVLCLLDGYYRGAGEWAVERGIDPATVIRAMHGVPARGVLEQRPAVRAALVQDGLAKA